MLGRQSVLEYGQGFRPKYAEAAASIYGAGDMGLTGEEATAPVSNDDVRTYVLALATSSGQEAGLLMDAVDELAFELDEDRHREPEVRAAAATDIGRRLGVQPDAAQEDALLGLTASMEADRLELASSARKGLSKVARAAYADDDEGEDDSDDRANEADSRAGAPVLAVGAQQPVNKSVTTETRAHGTRQKVEAYAALANRQAKGYKPGPGDNGNRSHPPRGDYYMPSGGKPQTRGR